MPTIPENTAPAPPRQNRAWWAFVGPFGVFEALLMLLALLRKLLGGEGGGTGAGAAPWWLATPEFWVYPLQTLVCGGLLARFWREYPLANRRPGELAIGVLAGVAALLVWIAPQLVFHAAPRTAGGFDPTGLPPGSAAYAWTLAFRFARLVVVVPFMEEIFWRGFLLRYLVREDFTAVPFGTFTWMSFGVTAAGFMLEHNPPDYPAALITGVLYNAVAVRTRSLPACITAHAVTNALLGLYIVQTRQWGFW